MFPAMREDGLTYKGVLVVAAVLLVAGSILTYAYNTMRTQTDEQIDADRMRQIYASLSLYEAANDGKPAPNLLAVRHELGDDRFYQAQNDPFLKSEPFPIDPALVDLAERSPVRISFSYFPDWVNANKASVKNWPDALKDVRQGILACYWYGKIDDQHPDGRLTDGPVIRINMDGSVYRLPTRSNKTELTAEDLFSRRSGSGQ